MKPAASALLENLLVRYPALEPCREAVFAAGEALIACYRAGGKLLICGNGGSCADGQHIVGELMKAFILLRKIDEADAKALEALDPEYGSFMADRLQGAQARQLVHVAPPPSSRYSSRFSSGPCRPASRSSA